MAVMSYRRTVDDLRQVASNFWPAELSEQEAEISIMPKLLETQEAFLSILKVPVADVENIFRIVDQSSLSGNLFLKHLVILADFGGEPLQNVSAHFREWFPNGTLKYLWTTENGVEERIYRFKALPGPRLSNPALGLDGRGLLKKQNLSPVHKDTIAVLLLGGASTDETVAENLTKCEISEYLGQPQKLDQFVRQRYLWVSRITGGARANSLGQLAQKAVHDYLQDHLGIAGAFLHVNGHVPGVRHTDGNERGETTFDLVVSKGERYVAIEVSFQVTTNSTIERKAGQARARYAQIEAKGHKIAYVLDGAGNFRRENAMRTICEHSHCTVAFSPSELEVLCDFIRKYFSGR